MLQKCNACEIGSHFSFMPNTNDKESFSKNQLLATE